jgi:hypothetical protein
MQTITGYDEAKKKISVVYKAYAACVVKGARDPKKEAFMLKTCTEASPPGTITYDVHYLYLYAQDVIKGRWPEAEPLIIRYTPSAIAYARNVLKNRWPELEEKLKLSYPPEELQRQERMSNLIFCDPVWYAREVMKLPEEEAVRLVFSPNFQRMGFNDVPEEETMHTMTGYDEATLNKEIRFAARFLKRPPPPRKLPLLDIERMHEMTGYDA